VHDVRLILDNKSHRSKGIAYVEFEEVDTVPLALGLSGQRLLGVPIIVQPSHAERNRIASAAAAAMKAAASATGPMRLYVGSLHYNITEEMLRGIFDPFGKASCLCPSHCFLAQWFCKCFVNESIFVGVEILVIVISLKGICLLICLYTSEQYNS